MFTSSARLTVPCVLIPCDFVVHIFLLELEENYRASDSFIPPNYRFLAWLVGRTVEPKFAFQEIPSPLLFFFSLATMKISPTTRYNILFSSEFYASPKPTMITIDIWKINIIRRKNGLRFIHYSFSIVFNHSWPIRFPLASLE